LKDDLVLSYHYYELNPKQWLFVLKKYGATHEILRIKGKESLMITEANSYERKWEKSLQIKENLSLCKTSEEEEEK